MELTEFQITNYRSINDTGIIKVKTRTSLVGRNESGKSNILLALQSLNPPEGMKTLSEVKDFPRDRPLGDFSPETPVVSTKWQLSNSEQAELARIFPRANSVYEISISRRYEAPSRYVGFSNLPAIAVDYDLITQLIKKIRQSLGPRIRSHKSGNVEELNLVLNELESKVLNKANSPDVWAANVQAALTKFREVSTTQNLIITDSAEQNFDEIHDHAINIQNDDKAWSRARTWAVNQLPVFIYLSDYPELKGHQSISEYINHRNSQDLTEADKNFEKLCKVAGLNPDDLSNLLNSDHEKRHLLANRAGAVVTQKIRELWTDRPLKIRFNLDADHLDTLISDPTSVYDVEVNLDERSRGFKWFFSFYIAFTADTMSGSAEKAILLLDEPGLYLHAVAQQDLLSHFAKDFNNQIIFTTHSPFMIPVDDMDSIRTVNIAQDTATVVSNDPIGDERTLFPLQTALGYNAAQSLFIGQNNLIVEGVSDFWYLSAASDYLNEINGSGLPRELVITPAGGAQRVSYMVTLLNSHRLKVLVLFDEESDSRTTADDLVKSKMIRNEYVIFISDGFANKPSSGADIEDLIDPDIYTNLVLDSYAKELTGKTLKVNAQIPRIAKRYEVAFRDLNIQFSKTRIARFFLQKIAENPSAIFTSITQQNFERIFSEISRRLEIQIKKNAEPFR